MVVCSPVTILGAWYTSRRAEATDPSPSSLTGLQKYLPAESSVANSMVNSGPRESVLELDPSFHQRYSGAGKPGGSAPQRMLTLLPSTALGSSGLMNALPGWCRTLMA